MIFLRILRLQLFILIAALAAVAASVQGARASDHRESPEIVGNPNADIADFYAFLNPHDSSKLVMVMTVNGYAVPALEKRYMFSPKVRYRFNIDNNGDYRPDEGVELRFGEAEFTHKVHGVWTSQTFTATFSMRRIEPVRGSCTPATEVLQAALDPVVFDGADGVKVYAGLRDDPFFFNLTGSDRVFAGQQPKFLSGIDNFAGFNVSAIVVEIPLSSVYRGRPLHLWATTEELSRDRSWRQIQRVGNPAVKGVYIPSTMLARYNASQPAEDVANYKSVAAGAAEAAFHLDQATLQRLLSILIPDTLTLDPTKTIRSPNGRALDDSLGLMFWFNLNTPIAFKPGDDPTDLDGVLGNDVPNRDRFPYLAPPHSPPACHGPSCP
jgi:hypothetical protein